MVDSSRPALVDIARQRYEFDRWADANARGAALFVWNLSADDVTPPGWQLVRSSVFRRLAIDAARQLHFTAAAVESLPTPTVRLSLWVPARRSRVLTASVLPGSVLRLDAFECASRFAAHQWVLRLLVEFESTPIERKEAGLGDVAFGGRSDSMLLFAQANVVCLIRNIGDVLAPAAAIAREIGIRMLPPDVAEPVLPGMGVVVARDDQTVAAGKKKSRILVAHLTDDMRDQEGCHWFAADAGEFVQEGNAVVYEGPAEHVERIRIVRRPPDVATLSERTVSRLT